MDEGRPIKVRVACWKRSSLLDGTPYEGEPVVERTRAEALAIIGEMYERGLQVMVVRSGFRDVDMLIWVDDGWFMETDG